MSNELLDYGGVGDEDDKLEADEGGDGSDSEACGDAGGEDAASEQAGEDAPTANENAPTDSLDPESDFPLVDNNAGGGEAADGGDGGGRGRGRGRGRRRGSAYLWRCGRCGRAVQTPVGRLGCAYGCAQAGHAGGDLELMVRNGGRTGWQRRQLQAGGGHRGVKNVPYGTEKLSLPNSCALQSGAASGLKSDQVIIRNDSHSV
mmetsp:Transcript_34231/g.86227  ORF Transcript_34231/g.86227 Transcript_34231/m.86227 type:complete len:203 (-) Transcript_34231:1166-1774(-)